ncbi:ATP-dependent nuclease [Deinococcus navajonensis]|uniref:ATP-dependent endonuclease n=1 Tax=Deinococcus navajonensis TaxID=309884 RepID=A0ABV8XM50_9DEIO
MKAIRTPEGRITRLDWSEQLEVGETRVTGRRIMLPGEQLDAQLHLDLHPELTVLLGVNGNGKSTLIRSLEWLQETPGGDLEWGWFDPVSMHLQGNPRRVIHGPPLATVIDLEKLPGLKSRIKAAEMSDLAPGHSWGIDGRPTFDVNTRIIQEFRVRLEDFWGLEHPLWQLAMHDQGLLRTLNDRLRTLHPEPVQLELHPADLGDEPRFLLGLNSAVRGQETRRLIGYSLLSRGLQAMVGLVCLAELARREHHVGAPPILIFDDPGRDLHPRAKKRLMSYLEELSKARQAIVATHDPELIPKDDEKIRVLERAGHGNPMISRPDWGRHREEVTPYFKARRLDLADNLLAGKLPMLLEGTSDEDILLAVQRDLRYQGEQLNRHLQPVVSKGTSGIKTFVPLLMGTGRPFLVLIDSDARTAERKWLEQEMAPSAPILLGGFGRLQNRCTCVTPYAQEQCRQITLGRLAVRSAERRCGLGSIEDLFEPDEYVSLFNAAFALVLPVRPPMSEEEQALPLVDWINGQLQGHPEAQQHEKDTEKPIRLDAPGQGHRGPTWQFHGVVARFFADNIRQVHLSDGTLARFAALIGTINAHADVLTA